MIMSNLFFACVCDKDFYPLLILIHTTVVVYNLQMSLLCDKPHHIFVTVNFCYATIFQLKMSKPITLMPCYIAMISIHCKLSE